MRVKQIKIIVFKGGNKRKINITFAKPSGLFKDPPSFFKLQKRLQF